MTEGNSAKLFVTRPKSFQEALKLINNAKTSIQFETFTLNGKQGLAIAQALIAARARGVNVQAIVDSKSLLVDTGMSLATMLRENGVDVRIYQERNLNDPLVAIDHAKQLLVDGQTVLVGDSNFDRFVDYDMDYELQGPAVPKLQAMFAQSWANAKGTGPLVTAGLPSVNPVPTAKGWPVIGGDTQIGITETAPSSDTQVGDQTYQNTLKAIANSQKSIDLLMYTMGDPTELDALKAAAKRGVHVRVVLSPTKRFYNLEAVRELKEAGIDVRWFKLPPNLNEMHAKVAIFDGKTALGGSTNWVHSSNQDNHELGVWMQGAIVNQMEQTYDQVWKTKTTSISSLSFLSNIDADVMNGVTRII